jgi:hypothetical protein
MRLCAAVRSPIRTWSATAVANWPGFETKAEPPSVTPATACELRLAQKGVQFLCVHSALPAARAERYQEVARAVIIRIRSQHEVATWHLNCSH